MAPEPSETASDAGLDALVVSEPLTLSAPPLPDVLEARVIGSEASASDILFRQIATRVAVVGTWLLAAGFATFLGYHAAFRTASEGSWVLQTMERNFGATIGVPLAAISAVCIVLILESTSGPIRFEALGFKFRGASGPVIMWLMCFLALVLAMKMLWVP